MMPSPSPAPSEKNRRMKLTRRVNVAARLRRSKRGNVLIIFGFAMIPMVFATGMGIDYARAARLQTKLNAIADAAALAAVTQPMMLNSDSQAQQAAKNMFNAQAEALGTDLIYNPGDLQVTITPVYSASTPGRDCGSSLYR